MLLVLSNSKDETADYLCTRIAAERLPFVRLDSDSVARKSSLVARGGEIRIRLSGREFSPRQISNVWYRRPEAIRVPRGGDGGERRHAAEEWAAALEGFLSLIPRSRWMNHPASNASASLKLEQLVRARRLGFGVPRTLLTQNEGEVRKFWSECDGRVVVKPVSDGRIRGTRDRLVYTNVLQKRHLDSLEDVRNCPTLFQEKIEKIADVRVTAVGDRLIAISMVGSKRDEVDIRRENMSGVKYRELEVPGRTARKLVAMMRGYGLRFGAFDFGVRPDGSWVFFELNPNGQWAWLDEAANARIAGRLIEEFFHG